MNRLALVNRARRECGVSGADLATLTAQASKETQRFIDWIDDAWREVQMHREDWLWMRRTASFDTAAGQGIYTPVTDVSEWMPDTFRCWLKSAGRAGEVPMNFIDFDSWRARFDVGALRTTPGMPLWLAAAGDRSLRLWPIPAAVYSIEGDYRRAPTALAADADTPETGGLPERFHMLIVYKAMLAYGGFEAASEVLDRAARGEKREMGRLEAWGLPAMTMGSALA